jgi:hypothetical protein
MRPPTSGVILYRVAKLWNQTRRLDRPDGLLIVTPHRLAFLTKITTITTEFLFPTQISSTSKPPG